MAHRRGSVSLELIGVVTLYVKGMWPQLCGVCSP